MAKIKSLCQDFNWEVRHGICIVLYDVSAYIGEQNSIEKVLPEI